MFSGIWQLLFNPFHDLPEGGSVEGVRIPAGPHNLIPAQQRTDTQTPLLVFSQYILFLFLSVCVCVYCFLFSVPPCQCLLYLWKAKFNRKRAGCCSNAPHIAFFIVSPSPSTQSHHLSCGTSQHNTFNLHSYSMSAITHISLGANSGASILYPSFISL